MVINELCWLVIVAPVVSVVVSVRIIGAVPAVVLATWRVRLWPILVVIIVVREIATFLLRGRVLAIELRLIIIATRVLRVR